MTQLREALAELDAAWARLGCPVAEYYAPGARRAEIVEAVSFITSEPPEELIDWYEWHNGWMERSRAVTIAPSSYEPLSLQDARVVRDSMAATAVLGSDDPDLVHPPEYYWDPHWWPIGDTGARGLLVVDLASTDQSCVVRSVAWDDPDFRQPMASSLLAVVRIYLEVIDLGVLTWVEDSTVNWQLDFARVPVEMRRRI